MGETQASSTAIREIMELSEILNAETARDIRFEAQCLRSSTSWWRTTMRPLLNDVAHIEATDLLAKEMDSVAERLERLSLVASRPQGRA
jgi:hypothetical protein